MGAHLHFDCYSGISGDMILGALVDAGVPFPDLVSGLKRLRLSGFTLRKRRVHRGAIHAVKVDVVITSGLRKPLSLHRIHAILSASRLPDKIKQQSRSVFDRLAEAEGHAHRVAKDHVHFHEVGVVDSFVDIVGGLIVLRSVGRDACDGLSRQCWNRNAAIGSRDPSGAWSGGRHSGERDSDIQRRPAP